CSSDRNAAASDHSSPLSTGLRYRRKRVSRMPNAATKASTGNCDTGDQRCLPQKAGCRKAGAVASPGRQITATNTDSKNSIAKAGRIAGNDKPRSRLKEKAIKFSGSRTATASSAICPEPEGLIRPAAKNSTARCARNSVSNASNTRLEWKRQDSRIPVTKTA